MSLKKSSYVLGTIAILTASLIWLSCETPTPPNFDPPKIINDTIIGKGSRIMDTPYFMYVYISDAENLTYQWSKDGEVIKYQELDTLKFNALTMNDSGTYTFTVSNPFGSDKSEPFDLKVIYVDKNKPIIKLISPDNKSITANTKIKIRFSVFDESNITNVTVNTSTVAPKDTTGDTLFYEYSISDIKDTTNVIIIAEDTIKNIDTLKAMFYYNETAEDIEKPDIVLLSHSDSATVNDTIIIISYKIIDTSGISFVSINGKSLKLADSIYTDTFILAADINTIKTIAIDSSLKKNSATHITTIFYIENESPKWLSNPIKKTLSEGKEFVLDLLDVCTDPENDTITFSMIAGEPTGDTIAGNLYKFSPSFTDAGDYEIMLWADDGNQSSSTILELNIKNENQKPEFEKDLPKKSYIVPEGDSLFIIFNAKDGDFDHISYSISKNTLPRPETATLDTTKNRIAWKSQPNDLGIYSIQLLGTDGEDTDTANINIGVGNVNLPPQIHCDAFKSGDTLSVTETNTLTCKLTITDPNNDDKPVFFPVKNSPNTSVFDTATGLFTYTPDYSISDKQNNTIFKDIVFLATDNISRAIDSIVLHITVKDLNASPICGNLTKNVEEDIESGINIPATDADNEPLTWKIITSPTKGTVGSANGSIGSGDEISYTAKNFISSTDDKIMVEITDGIASCTASVTISISADNDPPIADDVKQIVVKEDDPNGENFNITGTDPEGKILTWEVVTNPAHGAIAVINSTLNDSDPEGNYKPAKNNTTNTSFTFKLSDGVNFSKTDTVLIILNGENDAPVISAIGEQKTNEGGSFATIDLNPYVNDIETVNANIKWSFSGNSNLSAAINSTTKIATITINDMDWNGSETITFRATDEGDLWDETGVIFSVAPVNDAPSFTKGVDQDIDEDDGTQTINGWATNIKAGPSNESGQTLTFTVTNNNNGLFAVQPSINSSGALNYKAKSDMNGDAEVSVALKDNGNGTSPNINTSTVQKFNIVVNSINDAPVCANVSKSVNENETIVIDIPATDIDIADALTWSITDGPNYGSITQSNFDIGSGNEFTYKANNLKENKTDIVKIRISDGNGRATCDMEVSISITASNQSPVLQAISDINMAEDQTNTVSVNIIATDPESGISGLQWGTSQDPTKVTLSSSSGSISNIGNEFTITVKQDAFGSDVIKLKVTDAENNTSNEITVNINISSVNDLPTIKITGTAPQNKVTFGSDVTINVDYADKEGYRYIKLEVDGNVQQTIDVSGTFGSYPFTWNEPYHSRVIGDHSVKIIGIDSDGASCEDEITFHIDGTVESDNLSVKAFYEENDLEFNNDLTTRETSFGLDGVSSITIFSVDLCNLDVVERIGFNMTEISFLPTEISKLKNLERLSFSGNNISSLPSGFKDLPKLKYLNINNNNFSSIPDEIYQIISLEEINFSSQKNTLSNISPQIGNLVNLFSIAMAGNSIQTLPDEIGSLSKLQKIYMQNNKLTSLPSTITNLFPENMGQVDFGNNDLNDVGTADWQTWLDQVDTDWRDTNP